jgi:hypothetical protein
MKKIEPILLIAAVAGVIFTFMNYEWGTLVLMLSFLALIVFYFSGQYIIPYDILYRKPKNRNEKLKILSAVTNIQLVSGVALAVGVFSLGWSVKRLQYAQDISKWAIIFSCAMVITCIIMVCVKWRPVGLWSTFVRILVMTTLLIFVRYQSLQIESFQYGSLRTIFLTIHKYKANPANESAPDDLQSIRDNYQLYQRLLVDPDLDAARTLWLEDIYDFYNVDYPGKSIRKYPFESY